MFQDAHRERIKRSKKLLETDLETFVNIGEI